MSQEQQNGANAPQAQPPANSPAKTDPMLPYERLGRAAEIQTVPMENSLGLYLNPVLFEQGMRAAGVLATSGILPKHYQENQSACFLLLAMSSALQMNPIMLAQKSYIVHGKFAFEAQAMIALANKSGLFASPLNWEYSGSGDTRAVVCFTTRKADGAKIAADCSVQMAKAFGWWGKNDSMWPKMTDQMLAYRSASFLLSRYAPEVKLGLYTTDEMQDMGPSIDAEYTAISGDASPEVYDTAPFDSAVSGQGMNPDDEHLAAFINQIASQNRIPADKVKMEAAGDMERFIATFTAWLEKQKTAPAEKKAQAQAKTEQAKTPPTDDPFPAFPETVTCPRNKTVVRPAVECQKCPEFKGCPELFPNQ